MTEQKRIRQTYRFKKPFELRLPMVLCPHCGEIGHCYLLVSGVRFPKDALVITRSREKYKEARREKEKEKDGGGVSSQNPTNTLSPYSPPSPKENDGKEGSQ